MWLLILLAVVGALALGMHTLFPDALRLEHNRMSLVYYVVWIVVIGSAILMTFRQRWSDAIKYAIAWALILFVVIAAYAYKDDLEQVAMQVAAVVVPGMAVETAPGEVVLRASADGHFYANATVDGVAIRFLVDTGASTIVLSAEDARRVGFDPEALDYFLPVTTARGPALAARVSLDEVRLGGIAVQRVAAAVMPPGTLDRSLLGMAFLERLAGFEIAGDRLVLRR
ncbi:MAG: TIGR02281 family clan AA aspartic protease [Geminicoccaceae bacterium]